MAKVGYLYRQEDENKISGTGRVAEVFVSDTGKAVVIWLSDTPSVNVYDSVGAVRTTHGHEGKTELIFEPDYKGAFNEMKSFIDGFSLTDIIQGKLPADADARNLLDLGEKKSK